MHRFLALAVGVTILIAAAAPPALAEQRGRQYDGRYRGEYHEPQRRGWVGPGGVVYPPPVYYPPPVVYAPPAQSFGYVPPPAYSNVAPLGWGWR